MKIGITQQSAGRIRRAVEVVEGRNRSHGELPPSNSNRANDVWVEITSTTQTDNRYPGSVYYRNGNEATYTLVGSSGGVWVDTPNGETLSLSTKYRACNSGIKAADGKPIFDAFSTAKDQNIRGKLDAELTYQGSATMSIWWYNGSAEADSGDNVTVYDWLLSTGQTIASGKQVTASWDARSGRYYVTGAQCA